AGEHDGQRGDSHDGYGIATHATAHFGVRSGRGHNFATLVTESQRFSHHWSQVEPLNEMDTSRSAELVRASRRGHGGSPHTPACVPHNRERNARGRSRKCRHSLHTRGSPEAAEPPGSTRVFTGRRCQSACCCRFGRHTTSALVCWTSW